MEKWMDRALNKYKNISLDSQIAKNVVKKVISLSCAPNKGKNGNLTSGDNCVISAGSDKNIRFWQLSSENNLEGKKKEINKYGLFSKADAH
jgi:hypothetical protein